jgi:tRNA U34 5-methylaminomethyl-2-thiouridine-forming methyltransferase MnmC
MGRIIKTSEDGSHTILNENINETYHSVHGAITESEHVFINACYLLLKKEKIRVLEVGFGTGLNAWLTAIQAEKNNTLTVYDSFELYPLEAEIYLKLNYPEIKYTEFKPVFSKIHNAEWGIETSISTNFLIKKIFADITISELDGQYDAIFFDAFSPEKQPEMWTRPVFEKIFHSMSVGGILTTYCAKGIIKRLLKEIGFSIELIPGPPGKWHMIRALKV